MVEHLDLDAPFRQFVGRQAVERLHRHPGEHAGVASRFQVAPFDDQLEVEELVARAHHADRHARRREDIAVPPPRVRVVVHAGEVVRAKRAPARAGAVDERLRLVRRCLAGEVGAQRTSHYDHGEGEQDGGNAHGRRYGGPLVASIAGRALRSRTTGSIRYDHLPFLQKRIPAVWLFGGFPLATTSPWTPSIASTSTRWRARPSHRRCRACPCVEGRAAPFSLPSRRALTSRRPLPCTNRA